MLKKAPFCNIKEGEKTFLDMTPKGDGVSSGQRPSYQPINQKK